MIVVAIFLFILSVYCCLESQCQQCLQSFPSYGVTYDLTGLTLTASDPLDYYTVIDANNPSQYRYFFNICAQTVSIPLPGNCDSGTVMTQRHHCTQYSGGSCIGNTVPNNSTAHVWQADIINTVCFRLSSINGGPPQFSLISTSDPAAGIIMSFDGGDNVGCPGTNRRMFLHFHCDYDAANIPDSEEVTETSTCVYHMDALHSPFGCPVECHSEYGAHCANHGTCGYDSIALSAKCFCYFGYGSDFFYPL